MADQRLLKVGKILLGLGALLIFVDLVLGAVFSAFRGAPFAPPGVIKAVVDLVAILAALGAFVEAPDLVWTLVAIVVTLVAGGDGGTIAAVGGIIVLISRYI